MAESIQDTATLHNGVAIPWLGLGTWKAAEGGDVEQAIGSALELGYRSIDTATVYGNEAGVGRAIADSSIARDELFVTTKVWNSDQGYDSTLAAFDASLQRLGLDHVDLYLVHWPVQGKYKQTWKALEQIYRDGRARAIGVSNFLEHHLRDLLAEAEVVPMVNQIEFHPHLVQPDLLAFCREQRIQVEAWSPLMRGEVFEIAEIREIAETHGKTPAQVVLRWNLQHAVVTIPKSVRREHIAANADLFDFRLSDEEMNTLDRLDQHRRIGPDPDHVDF